MAWVMIVDGKSFNISSGIHDGYSERDSIKKALTEEISKAKENEILINVNFNDELEILTIFVGKEIHEDRTIYKGETITVEKITDSLIHEKISSYSEKIKDVITSLNYKFEEKNGVVIWHFD